MRISTLTALLAAATTLSIAGLASATSSANGVFYVHGTGDQAPPTSAASAQYASGGVVDAYWQQGTLDKYSTSPDGSGKWSYGAAGYPGGSKAAYDSASWGAVADQLQAYYMSGNGGAIYHITVVTHSNGSNPLRYLQAHPTAVTPGGNTVSTVLSHVSRVIYIAGDNGGTPLADKVTTSGSFANIGNDIVSFFGGGSYNTPAVVQQVQANMGTYNGNGTFGVGSAPGGISTQYLYGTGVYAAIWSGDAWCGGYPQTVGLKAAQVYGWGSSSATTDGFIGTTTATLTNSCEYMSGGTLYWSGSTPCNVSSKLVGINGMPGNSGDTRLNHNQSHRDCHGFSSTVASNIHGAMSNTFSAPADYSISSAAMACDATTAWTSALGKDSSGNSWTWKQYGCTSTQKASTSTVWRDCYDAYGYSAAATATFTSSNVSDGWTSTDYAAANYNHSVSTSTDGGVTYATYQYTSTTACPDSWLGDGVCDLCLVAKYGFDSASGQTQDDDCVTAASGGTNYCSDLGPTYKNGVYQWDSVASYTVTH